STSRSSRCARPAPRNWNMATCTARAATTTEPAAAGRFLPSLPADGPPCAGRFRFRIFQAGSHGDFRPVERGAPACANPRTPPGNARMSPDFQPIAVRERIQALDVVRGIALLGIALMNVEFFNRSIADLGAGMPVGATGADFWAGWLVHPFVRGKFWTMFSILFGMGFAVMLLRARDAGRGFVAPYLRRSLALAGFGLLHGVLLWTGDILLSYASTALVLLLVLFGRPWHGLAAAAAIA